MKYQVKMKRQYSKTHEMQWTQWLEGNLNVMPTLKKK